MTRQRNLAARRAIACHAATGRAVGVDRSKALIDAPASQGDVAATIDEIFASLDVERLQIEQPTSGLQGDAAIGCADIAGNPQAAACVVEAEVAVAILTLDVEWPDPGDLVVLVQGNVTLRRWRGKNRRPTIGVDPDKVARADDDAGSLRDLIVRIELHAARTRGEVAGKVNAIGVCRGELMARPDSHRTRCASGNYPG